MTSVLYTLIFTGTHVTNNHDLHHVILPSAWAKP